MTEKPEPVEPGPADAAEPPERPPHDASYKSFFARRRTVEDTLRAVVRDLADMLDLATLERMPASFVTEHLGRRHADMLWRVRASGGEWLYLLVLIEFQATTDRRMAVRMMNYSAGIWLGLGEQDLAPGGGYPLVLPIVVYNGERAWNAVTDVRDLLAPVPGPLLGMRPRHPYLLVELQSLDPSKLPGRSVLAMISRFEQARSAERLEQLVLALADWGERAGAQKLLETFGEWVAQVLAQRHGPKGRALESRIRSEQEAGMTTLIERARQWGEELNLEWLEKGRAEGRLEGKLEGRVEGKL